MKIAPEGPKFVVLDVPFNELIAFWYENSFGPWLAFETRIGFHTLLVVFFEGVAVDECSLVNGAHF